MEYFLLYINSCNIIIYYITRKFDSIDNYIDKSCLSGDNKSPDSYKKQKKKYKKNISELEAKVIPDGQNVINMADKLNELKKKK